MTDRVSEGRPQVLLVEGKTDEIFVGRLWERRQLKIRNWAIRPKNSVEALLDSIKNEVNVSDREVLGIIVDANNSLNNRWRAIRGRLQNANIDAPVCADPCGTVIEATLRTPRVGVWIMPDNVSSGELEDFVGQWCPLETQFGEVKNLYSEHPRFRTKIHSGEGKKSDRSRLAGGAKKSTSDWAGSSCKRSGH